MSNFNKRISVLIARMIPEHIRESYPSYVRFVQSYFEYIERDLGEYDLVANMLGYSDIDDAEKIPEFISEFRKTYAGALPSNIALDIKLLVKNIRSFYRAKGAEKSFEFLFRTLYDQEVKFYYPKVDMLRCSDGKWYVPTFIIADDVTTDVMSKFVDHEIQSNNGATAYVDKLQLIDDPLNPGSDILAIRLSSIKGQFSASDTFTSLTDSSLPTRTINQIELWQGYWTNEDGWLNSTKKIQDSYYYQDYSYELQVNLSVNLYRDLIKKVVHPAGMAMFGKVSALNGTLTNINAVQQVVEWIIQWTREVSVVATEGVLWNHVNELITSSKTHWTYGRIEADRNQPAVLQRFPNIHSFRHIKINEFDNSNDNFMYHPSPTITII